MENRILRKELEMIKVGKEPYLECSSKGDKRFSAMYARIKALDNKTIEEIYQASKIFTDGKTGLSVKECKGKKAINMDEVSKLYEKLWELYLKENPELIEELLKYNGYTDIFGKEGCQCQAKSIYRIVSNIRKERGKTMANVKELLNVGTKTKGVNAMKKQELLEKIAEQNKVIAELKGVKSMEQTEQKPFNVYEYTLNQIANAFIESDRSKDFTVTVRNLYDSKNNDIEYKGSGKILESLENIGAYIIESITPKRKIVDAKEVRYYEIKITNFDPSIRTTSKNTGKQYDVFFKQLPTKALRTVAQ